MAKIANALKKKKNRLGLNFIRVDKIATPHKLGVLLESILRTKHK